MKLEMVFLSAKPVSGKGGRHLGRDTYITKLHKLNREISKDRGEEERETGRGTFSVSQQLAWSLMWELRREFVPQTAHHCLMETQAWKALSPKPASSFSTFTPQSVMSLNQVPALDREVTEGVRETMVQATHNFGGSFKVMTESSRYLAQTQTLNLIPGFPSCTKPNWMLFFQ